MFRHFPNLMENKEAFDIGCRAILKADQKFNGTGNLGGFRSFCFKRSLSVFGKEPETICVTTEELDRRFSRHEVDLNMDLFEFCETVLTHLQYTILESYFRNGMTYTAISQEQDITLNKTTRELSRALDIMADTLEKDTYA
jgi:hypothetical protein